MKRQLIFCSNFINFIDEIKTDKEIKDIRKKLGIKENKFVVLGAGQIQNRKGVIDFVEVAKKLPKIDFIWAGGFSFGGITDGHHDLKKIMAEKPSRFTEGHRMCAGCGAPVVGRMVMRALKPEDHAVVANATGCMEVSTFIYPYTAWTDSFIHTAFENAGATCSGAEAAYKALKKQGKLPQDKDTKFIAFGGDGGTYDIGLQSLSGAMERGHDMVYVCYDNGAYMNTGIQRSSATPKFADTTTSPAGKVTPGKMQVRKDLAKVMVGHHIPYVAQTLAMNNFKDLYEKAEKAIYTEGPAFLNVMAPCPRGWGYPTEDLMKINKLAADTCYWPLYEVVDGKYHITYKPAKKLPVEEFLRPQKRFKHMFKPGNEWMIQEFQRVVDERWQELLDLEEITNRDARKKSGIIGANIRKTYI